MDTKQALEILIQAVHKANKLGAFELAESKVVAEAVEVFVKKPETNGTNTDTAPAGAEEKDVQVESKESAG